MARYSRTVRAAQVRFVEVGRVRARPLDVQHGAPRTLHFSGRLYWTFGQQGLHPADLMGILHTLLFLAAAALPPGAHAPVFPTSSLGMNLGANRDWQGEYKYADFMKVSRPWASGLLAYQGSAGYVPGAWQDAQPIILDAQGWVTRTAPHQVVRTLLGWSPNLRLPDGKYTVTYRGRGTLIYEGAATKIVAESCPGRDIVQVTARQVGSISNGGWSLGITDTDPTDYVRNIQIAPPGYDGLLDTVTFHADLVNALQPFSTVRWVQPQAINETAVDTMVRWADRPHLDDARWVVKGVPLEVPIRYSNETMAHAWLNVPARANDDFVRQMATLIRDSLNPALKVYIELSNEQWNEPAYPGTFRYMRDQGLALGYGRPRAGAAADPRLAATQFYARRSAEVCDLFAGVYGPALRGRVVCVVAGQAGNPWVLEQALRFVVPGRTGPTAALPVGRRVDAGAVGPYFQFAFTGDATVGRREAERLKSLSIAQVFTELETVVVPRTLTQTAGNLRAIALYPNLTAIAYEGGQHLITLGYHAGDTQLEELMNALNRDARMGPLYTQLLDGWKQQGGKLFVAFALAGAYGGGAYGRFGALEYLTQPPTPKYAELLRWSAANPRTW